MAAIAKVLASIDGAPNASGGLEVPSGATIQLSAESTVGWTQATWEFFDYPEGWTAPDGWSTRADGTVYFDGYTPPAFTMPANTTLWGVWMLRLSVILDNDPSVIFADEATCFSILSPKGQRGIGARESEQFTSPTTRMKRWLRSLQKNAIALEAAIDAIPGGGGEVAGRLVKAMADANQTLSAAESAKPFLKTTGALTAVRTVTYAAPADDDEVTQRVVLNTCTGYSIKISVGVGNDVIVEPGSKALIMLADDGVYPIADLPLDPRDFGCPWNGVDDDTPGLQAMNDAIPVGVTKPVRVQLPKGQGYCASDLELSRPMLIDGHGMKYTGTANTMNGLRFAPMRQLVLHGSSSSPDGGRCDYGSIRRLNVVSLQPIPVASGGNWGPLGYQLSTSTDTWTQLSATVQLGSCVLKSGATVSAPSDYYGDGLTRNTTHRVMFRCTTSGTKGSAEPAAFASATVADIGTTISASSGTAVWTVEAVPKDYTNGTTIVTGERVIIPGRNGNVFEALNGGTTRALAYTTVDAASNGVTPPAGTIYVASVADFPSSGIICVVTTTGRQFVSYTGTATGPARFTGCTVVSNFKSPSEASPPSATTNGTMATGNAVTGPFPYVYAGVPVSCVASFLSPGYRQEFYDIQATTSGSTSLPLAAGTVNVGSTFGFSSTGTAYLWNGTAYVPFTYTGITATSFTGCTSGGSGTVASGSTVGQGILWKEIFGGLVTVLASTVELDGLFVAGSMGRGAWLTAGYLNSFSGGTNFCKVRNCEFYQCGAGIEINTFNCNGNDTSHCQFGFMGAGRTYVDGPDYLNYRSTVSAPTADWDDGKYGNGGTAVYDLGGGSSHRAHYSQFSGGAPYRSDSLVSNGVGVASTFDACMHEHPLGAIHMLGGIVSTVAYVHPDSTVPSRGANSTTGARNWKFVAPMKTAPSRRINVDVAQKNGVISAAWRCQMSDEGTALAMAPSDEWNSYTSGIPTKWWIVGQADSQGYGLTQAYAIARPGTSPTWPGGTAVDSNTLPMWILQNRLWIGQSMTTHPPSIGFGTAAPSAEYFRQGSLTWNRSAGLGGTFGWVCTTAGASGGTQVAVSAVYFRSSNPSGGSETWTAPAVVFNSSAASGQPAGWICTASGTPGTWVAMADCP